jgi:hypothetical protein
MVSHGDGLARGTRAALCRAPGAKPPRRAAVAPPANPNAKTSPDASRAAKACQRANGRRCARPERNRAEVRIWKRGVDAT